MNPAESFPLGVCSSCRTGWDRHTEGCPLAPVDGKPPPPPCACKGRDQIDHRRGETGCLACDCHGAGFTHLRGAVGCTSDGPSGEAAAVRGIVQESGGGFFSVWVERDTESYPPIGMRGEWTARTEDEPVRVQGATEGEYRAYLAKMGYPQDQIDGHAAYHFPKPASTPSGTWPEGTSPEAIVEWLETDPARIRGDKNFKRPGTCVVDHLHDHPSSGSCRHGKVWPEGSEYGEDQGYACQPCIEGTCDHPKAPKADGYIAVPCTKCGKYHDPSKFCGIEAAIGETFPLATDGSTPFVSLCLYCQRKDGRHEDDCSAPADSRGKIVSEPELIHIDDLMPDLTFASVFDRIYDGYVQAERAAMADAWVNGLPRNPAPEPLPGIPKDATEHDLRQMVMGLQYKLRSAEMDRDRYLRRTHEIQEAESKRYGKMLREAKKLERESNPKVDVDDICGWPDCPTCGDKTREQEARHEMIATSASDFDGPILKVGVELSEDDEIVGMTFGPTSWPKRYRCATHNCKLSKCHKKHRSGCVPFDGRW